MENKGYKKLPVINGIYKHYKGGQYIVITLAKHSETDEDMVVYQSVHFGSIHVRPLNMWDEKVKSLISPSSTEMVPRFEIIE